MSTIMKPRLIIIHATMSYPYEDITVEKLWVRSILEGHKGIPYHFYIRRDGTVTQHRLLTEPGTHCKGYNNKSIGICYEGGQDEHGYPTDTRTEAQRRKMHDMITNLGYCFPGIRTIGMHDAHRYLDSPCFDAIAEFRE